MEQHYKQSPQWGNKSYFMQRMSIDKETIKVDYSRQDLPASARNFQPPVFRDGDTFVCIFGSDEKAVCGEGDSVESALEEWDKAYQQQKKKDD
jgi:hypothetical protein